MIASNPNSSSLFQDGSGASPLVIEKKESREFWKGNISPSTTMTLDLGVCHIEAMRRLVSRSV
jgi:hypothetical protein